MKRYIIDREMMLLALQWMPKELRDVWGSECLEVPDWATHVADVRTASEDSFSHVKLIQFVPIDMLKDLPEEMRRSGCSAPEK